MMVRGKTVEMLPLIYYGVERQGDVELVKCVRSLSLECARHLLFYIVELQKKIHTLSLGRQPRQQGVRDHKSSQLGRGFCNHHMQYAGQFAGTHHTPIGIAGPVDPGRQHMGIEMGR